MSDHRQPRSTAAAAELCERYAELDAQRVAIEAERQEKLAAINADSDRAVEPVVKELAILAGKLEPWWDKQGAAELTDGKRKSAELGGCEVGTRASRAKLVLIGEERDIVETLRPLRWAKPFVRVKYSLDRAATLKGLDGPHEGRLAELGIEREDGTKQFFIKRVDQGGTMGK